jgi:hypothetical protein
MKTSTKKQIAWFVFIWTASLLVTLAFSYTLRFIIHHL